MARPAAAPSRSASASNTLPSRSIGSTAGGVLQTAQRIGLAVGQAVIGAVFFASIDGPGPESYARALVAAVLVALCFVTASVAVGVRDLMRGRQARR